VIGDGPADFAFQMGIWVAGRWPDHCGSPETFDKGEKQ
jgi:hypothetical protein